MTTALRNASLAGATIVLGCTLFLLQGHSVSRSLQMAFLLLPGVLALLVPLPARATHRLRVALVALWTGMFLLDGAARALLADAYQAAPDSGFVITAVANTNWRESVEYARTVGPTVTGWIAVAALGTALVLYLASFGNRGQSPSRRVRILVACLLLLSLLAYASKPWRRLHPVLFWGAWAGSVTDMRDQWRHYGTVRARMLAQAAALAPKVEGTGPSTVMLVITDSVNRENMSLYGYARPTTPALATLKRQFGDNMLVIRDAWSVAASTLPSLNQMLVLDKDNDDGDDMHLLALARAAGYRTWWISNHDDLGIEQRHARFADVVQTVNRSPGRSGGGLDESVMTDVQAALANTAPRKLIVVHLLGAHPYYKLRYPKGADAFQAADAVDAKLAAAGRSWRTGALRKEYDSAIRYQDTVVARLLGLMEALPDQEGANHAWMYLSDHGQEVGDDANFAGHSPHTPGGYRIPALMWRNRPWADSVELQGRPFRADWASWAIADMLQLSWQGGTSRYNVLGRDYAWVDPRLPVGPSWRAKRP